MENLKNLDYKEILEMAKERVRDVPSGISFKVRDLFVGYQWDQIKVGDRKKIGLYFFVWVDSTASELLDVLDKSPSGQQMYRRK